ncbi:MULTISPECIES: DUF2802 domain-containing protein [Aliiglaciecola]|uniref:DUF2802 domain-containing protein n=1 Tax=Aliiglaciecola TaxID=1406885 RepID=UPI001C089516|nr:MULTISPECIES: DUF2802 domain-containing protein [Aliiglaciecola]MBU2879813.1 DUF2802 domain-containing protein [Aliiglaciecola lipolytica]MDO6709908.1 DUF2802 domain-containing protein [Aliiglaciecola sp. 2_MG-2023]MDO6751056.1 DUF2802 domain-containing protein [Aliiglaciecola sp. 1_MG-2023]
MLTWQYASIATLVFLVILIGIVTYVFANRDKKNKQRVDELMLQIHTLQQQISHAQEELHEVRSGAMGVAAKVKDLVLKIGLMQDKLEEIEYLDPETKLYSQAAKMADAGASVEELMRECELPRAEAELLIAVKKSQ